MGLPAVSQGGRWLSGDPTHNAEPFATRKRVIAFTCEPHFKRNQFGFSRHMNVPNQLKVLSGTALVPMMGLIGV